MFAYAQTESSTFLICCWYYISNYMEQWVFHKSAQYHLLNIFSLSESRSLDHLSHPHGSLKSCQLFIVSVVCPSSSCASLFSPTSELFLCLCEELTGYHSRSWWTRLKKNERASEQNKVVKHVTNGSTTEDTWEWDGEWCFFSSQEERKFKLFCLMLITLYDMIALWFW